MIRHTIQGDLVMEAVNFLKNHPTAENVFEHVRTEHPHVSKATVYRNLSRLAEEGLIKRLELANTADRFDHITEGHYHFRCAGCGAFFDIKVGGIAEIVQDFQDPAGNKIIGHEIIFNGMCFECNIYEKE